MISFDALRLLQDAKLRIGEELMNLEDGGKPQTVPVSERAISTGTDDAAQKAKLAAMVPTLNIVCIRF